MEGCWGRHGEPAGTVSPGSHAGGLEGLSGPGQKMRMAVVYLTVPVFFGKA